MTELPAGLSLPGPPRLEQQPKPLTLHPDSGAHRAVPGPQPEKCKRLWWPQQRAQGTQPVCWGGDGVWVQGCWSRAGRGGRDCLPPINLPACPVGGVPREAGCPLSLGGQGQRGDTARPAFTRLPALQPPQGAGQPTTKFVCDELRDEGRQQPGTRAEETGRGTRSLTRAGAFSLGF